MEELLPKQFNSNVHAPEERDCSGKWLVPIPFDDGLWLKIEEAARAGIFIAVKKSSAELDAILGHHLVCVYCSDSREITARNILDRLRELGVEGEIFYKTDKATYEENDDKMYISTTLEDESPGVVRHA